ncbi:MAG TPA: DNA ligase D [Armatimonadota bacterium]|nr:DNA ligase D [Armatimonadota bacterium]
MALKEYKEKRDFERSPEPKGEVKQSAGPLEFVVQKHQASHLHYDLRLELGGVLKSWAIPKGPSLKPGEKHLAQMVEDHPLDYMNFEGIIPEGNYGAGTVMIWDKGTYCSKETCDREDNESIFAEELEKGHLSFILNGEKLKGRFALARIRKSDDQNAWLLIKANDEFASDEDVTKQDHSAETGRSMGEIKEQASKAGEVWASSSDKLEGIDLSDAPEALMPHRVRPMLATLVDEAFDRKNWIFEIKWDGYRGIAEVGRGSVRLYSRNLLSFNERFPAIVEELPQIGVEAVLDGEIVVVDETGVSQFQLLQKYLRNRQGRLVYYVFDILWLEGHDLMGLPLTRRKEILTKVLPPNLTYIKYSDYIEEQGTALFRQALERRLEGVVAKKADSPYRPGIRGRDWLKMRVSLRQEMVIGGWTEPRGGRQYFGALVLGVFEGDQLVYTGHAGTGLDEKGLAYFMSKLKPLERKTSPFKETPKTNEPAHWVEPKLVVEVKFTGWTEDGLIRHPVILGLREDKRADDVRLEKPQPLQSDSSDTSDRSDPQETIGGHALKLTNLDKVFWPEERYTKGDVINYYRDIAGFILPYLRDRPESLNRFPDGIYGESFYQKNIREDQIPDWIETVKVKSETEDEYINYLLCQDEAALVYLANWGCIELNPWNSRVGSLDNPDYLLIDLDPGDIGFDAVIRVAQAVREVLDEAGIEGYPKTSGATGLHVYIPLGAKYTYGQTREFGRILAHLTCSKVPDIATVERMTAKRGNKVYVDFLQNARGQTLAAVYCIRPRPRATVSTPLEWDEIKPGLSPSRFTIRTIGKRLEKAGDLFKPVLGPGIDIRKALTRLSMNKAA